MSVLHASSSATQTAVGIRWEKRGLIFRPSDHALPFDHCEFAQSPQGVSLDDRVRIFFSTRTRDSSVGKFVSHICYVDFDHDLQRVLGVSKQPVIDQGGLGCFDEHGIFPLSPLRMGDQIYGYTCGWSRRVSVSVETGIGLAISENNGRSFRRIGTGPILSATLNEPCLVGDAFVLHCEGKFVMWYIYGRPWQRFSAGAPPDRIYKIAMATSDDGIRWTKRNEQPLVEDMLGPTECQALPTVMQVGGRYHLYFCFRHASDFRDHPDRGYRLGYAWSENLTQWHRNDAAVGIQRSEETTAWDCQMMCYPNVFQHRGRTFLLYNGNHFGREGFGVAVGTMEGSDIVIRVNEASQQAIASHLNACDQDFSTRLSERVDVSAYAKKLNEQATTIEAWRGDRLIGLLAAYVETQTLESPISRTAKSFISNVSVLRESRRRGVAKRLMARLLRELDRRLASSDVLTCEIELEVARDSPSALGLYAQCGFHVFDDNQTTIRMRRSTQVAPSVSDHNTKRS